MYVVRAGGVRWKVQPDVGDCGAYFTVVVRRERVGVRALPCVILRVSRVGKVVEAGADARVRLADVPPDVIQFVELAMRRALRKAA